MASTQANVAGVLAAGTSSRMGRNRMLFELRGETFLRRTARRALDGGLSPLHVVLGYEADRAHQEIADLACTPVIHVDFHLGIASSLRAGIASLPPNVPAAMVLLADMPFVTANMIRHMIARYALPGRRS